MWAVLFAGVQAFVFAWSAQGLIEADEGALMLMSVVVLDIACLAAAHLSLSRRAASSRLMLAAAPSDWTAYRVVSVFVALTALAAAAALCVLAVELPHNFALEQVNAKTVFVEWELLYAALVGLYFLGQRHAVLPSLVPVARMGIGVAEHFVFLFKGQPIQPGDMLAIGTAAAVSDGYVYTLSAQCLWGLTAGVAALLVCVVLARFRRRPEHFSDACFSPAHRNAGILANAIAGAAVLACIVSNVTGVDYCSSYGITINSWYIVESYSTQAYIPTFIAACQLMQPTKPEGYSANGGEALLSSYEAAYDSSDDALGLARGAAEAQFAQERPSVVAVMNETFSDLSIFDGMHAGYTGPEYFNSMADCARRGRPAGGRVRLADPTLGRGPGVLHRAAPRARPAGGPRVLRRPSAVLDAGVQRPVVSGRGRRRARAARLPDRLRRVGQLRHRGVRPGQRGGRRLRELFGLGGGAAYRRAAHFFPEGAHRAAARPPEISAACYEDAAGGWFLPNVDCGIDATDQARADFATMQFYDLFRDGQGIYSSQLQDEPNVDPVAR